MAVRRLGLERARPTVINLPVRALRPTFIFLMLRYNDTMLKVGTVAPNFGLADQNGKTHALADYRGQPVLLYFYPEDDTAGCTKEACVIRELYQEFESNHVKVLGVSADSVESHLKFANKYGLPFTLLADPSGKVIKLYEAAKNDGPRAKRVSYLIGHEGTIMKVYPKVDPTTHGLEILKDIKTL